MFSSIYLINNLYVYINNKNFTLVDYYNRINFSETPINFYYFIWTNAFYLYIFIFLSIFILFFLKLTKYNYYYLFYCFLLFIFVFFDVYFINSFSKQLNFDFNSNNVLLSNKINKIHPLIFFYVFIFSIFSNFNHTWDFFTKNSVLFFILLTIFLGGWWAFQEGSWGGWWDWDASELFSLFIVYNVIFMMHKPIKIIHSSLSTRSNTIMLNFMTIFFYTLLQISLSVVSHNFGIIQTGSFWHLNYLIFYFISFFIYIYIYRLNLFKIGINIYITFNFKNIKLFNSFGLFYKFLFFLIVGFIIYLSFAIMLTEYFKNLSTLVISLLPKNFFNFLSFLLHIYLIYIFFLKKIFYIFVIYISSFLLATIYSDILSNYYFYYVLFMMCTNYYIITSSVFNIYKKIYHTFFFIFVLWSLYLIFIKQHISSPIQNFIFLDYFSILLKSSNFFIIDNFNIFKINFNIFNNYLLSVNSKFSSIGTFNNTNYFINYFNFNNVIQIRLPFTNNFRIFSHLEEFNTLILFIIYLFFLFFTFSKKIVLLFFIKIKF